MIMSYTSRKYFSFSFGEWIREGLLVLDWALAVLRRKLDE